MATSSDMSGTVSNTLSAAPTFHLTSDLGALSSHQLLALYAGVLSELLRRKVIRTLNAPAGDLAETLVARALGGELAPNSEKSWDIRDGAGHHIQVKARVVAAANATKPIQFSVFRSWDFHSAVFVVFAADTYEVMAAIEVPADVVKEKAQAVAWVGGSRITVSLAVLRALPNAIDRTDAVREALEQLDVAAAPSPPRN